MDPAQFQANLRNLRDFLQVYNRLTEHCFSRCVSNMNYRYLTREEELCLDGCSGKLINANHRIIQKFAEVGPYAKMQQEQQRAAEQAAAEEAAQAAQAGAAGATDIPTGVSDVPHAVPGVDLQLPAGVPHDLQLPAGAPPGQDSGVTATEVLGAMGGQPAPVFGADAGASIGSLGSTGLQGLTTNTTQQQQSET